MLERYKTGLATLATWRWNGQVLESIGSTVESLGPLASIGECCEIRDHQGRTHPAEIIGFRGSHVLSMPLENLSGIRFGDTVTALGVRPQIRAGDSLLGRVLNASGFAIDGDNPLQALVPLSVEGRVHSPLERTPIVEPIGTGVRPIDSLLTVGRGQRMGIFGGSGVGKSTLIGMMTRNTDADLNVVALVGERGREVGEFLEHSLGEMGRARSIVIVATSDQSPLLRIRAALGATAIAEHFAARGKNVLLVLDSLTRFAMAAREVGLAAGEPPTSKGYTPSVFTRLAKLVERAGRFSRGSITAFYTVLMEGDDQQDPIVDAARSLLDGHIVLDRSLTAEGWYPPISILDSISRLMPALVDANHRAHAALVRRLLSTYARSQDLVRIGAYKPGTDADLDRALAARAALRSFLTQDSSESSNLRSCIAQLAKVAGEI